MRRFRSWCGRSCVVLAGFVLLGAGSTAAAQSQLASIQGTITDQTGAVLANISVSVTNRDTGEIRTTLTNASGIYRILGLDPGVYTVVISGAPGFAEIERADITASVGATMVVNVTVLPRPVPQHVHVEATDPDLQTQRAELSSIVERQRIMDLPVAGRNPLGLAVFQPGIVGLPGVTDFLMQEQEMRFNASGQRISANSALVDGMSVNGLAWGGSALIIPNPEAVQEIRVVANTPSAELGRNAGATVSLVTRSGTNEIHGSGLWFHRNNDLRARTLFESRKEAFHRNDAGVSIGGPIRRDRAFFFFSLAAVDEKTASSQQFTVETEQFRDFVSATRPGTNAAYLLNEFRPPAYPTENLRDLGSPALGVRVIGPPDGIADVGTINHAITNDRRGYQLSGRFDQVFHNHRLRASAYTTQITPEFVTLRPAFDYPFPHRSIFVNVGHSHVVSNQSVNELSAGFVRLHGEARDPTPHVPTVFIAGISGRFGADSFHPLEVSQNNLEIKNSFTSSRGRHHLRVGGELRLGFVPSELHPWERPNYTFSAPPGFVNSSGILDFADDEPFSERRAVDPSTGRATFTPADFREREFALFVQDHWTVRRHLTLNLGLRYEVFMSPKKTNGPFNAITLGPGPTRQDQIRDARVGTRDELFKTDWNNVAPRVGAVWDFGGAAQTVVRGGGGVSYNRINITAWDDRLNPPQFANAFIDGRDNIPLVYTLGPDYPPNPALGRGLDERGGIRGARVDLQVIDPETTVPHTYHWFAGVQQRLPWHFVGEAHYIGTAARNLMNFDASNGEDYNRVSGDLADGVRDRLNPSFGAIRMAESRIASNYHALAVQLNRRFRRGLSVQSTYTLGRVKDHPGSAEEVTDPQRDYGHATFDVRHNLALNVIWQIPAPRWNTRWRHALADWQLNTVTIWRSGTPFTVTCGTCDFNLDGQEGDRPNLPSFGTRLPDFTRDEWLAGALVASDYPPPAAGQLGTLPRNAFYGPGYFNADVSLIRRVPVRLVGGRSQTLQVRVEAYNVFKTSNLANPNANLSNVNFGRVTALRTGDLPGSRLIQLAAKFLF